MGTQTMTLHGKHFIGSKLEAANQGSIYGYDPREGKQLPTAFPEATAQEIDRAMQLAESAFTAYRLCSAEQVATFLEAIATEIEALGDALLELAASESGLGKDRLTGERARTVGQARLFASLVKEGSSIDARIDTALPDRKPLPRPDLRRMLTGIGPVVVFGASNFPLAFSVAGGDTISALAAKNPVVVKAHPAHPGTSELVASAIAKAVASSGLPEGVFSMVHGAKPETSLALVRHAAAKAVAFTGSEKAGMSIFNAAAQRPDPIPAFVEMGSTNPVFVLPSAIRNSAETVVKGLFGSINLGVGQFCTSPGLVFGRADESFQKFGTQLAEAFVQGTPATMLHPGILSGYQASLERTAKISGVREVRASKPAEKNKTEATPTLFEADLTTWLNNPELAVEIFGPSAIVVSGKTKEDLIKAAHSLKGSLTATIFGDEADLREYKELIAVLETKVGRIIFNGYPTGVEVSPAMHHGGPHPATADSKFTSVGTAAILRFLRPVCFQNFPDQLLPVELQNANARKLWRTLNGKLTQDEVPAGKEA